MTIQENLVFAYVKVQNPVKGMNDGDTEFTVDCIMSKAAAKAWNKEHPKNKTKSFDNEEFLEKFRFEELPFEDQDEQYVMKAKKAHGKQGVELPAKYRPRVFELVDGKPVDVTFTKLVGNGSKGKLSFSTFSNTFGTFVQLDAILVQEMIEYQGGGAAIGSEFGATELAEIPANQKVVQKQGEKSDEDDEDEKPKAKTTKKKVVKEDDDDDQGSPF